MQCNLQLSCPVHPMAPTESVGWKIVKKKPNKHICRQSGKTSACLHSWLYPNRWIKRSKAILRLLNIPDSTVRQVAVRVGGTLHAGGLSILVQACVVRPMDLPWNAAAFLKVSRITHANPSHRLFDGWLIANDPAAAVLQTRTIAVDLVGCGPTNKRSKDDRRH